LAQLVMQCRCTMHEELWAGDWLMNDNPKPQINFKKMLLRCTGVIPDYWSRHSVG